MGHLEELHEEGEGVDEDSPRGDEERVEVEAVASFECHPDHEVEFQDVVPGDGGEGAEGHGDGEGGGFEAAGDAVVS